MTPKKFKLPTFLAILHVAIRISLSNKAPITDCDEVYNYWEPLHFMHYGYGMQTWEYAPTFALRTYAYLLPLSYIARGYETILNLLPKSTIQTLSNALSPVSLTSSATEAFMAHKPLQFHLLRATLAFVTSITELRLVQALPSHLSIPTWIILLTSTGMFHTAPAYLPSTTVMICFMHSIVEQLNGKMNRAILWGLISCLMTGWPFCAVLFIPLGFQAVYVAYVKSCGGNKILSVMKLLTRVVAYSIMIQTVVTAIDYLYYGKVLSPTYNIFVYNTGWGGDGINRDELYGVDGVSYYIKNLILNWNVVAVLGVLALPLLVLKHLLISRKAKNTKTHGKTNDPSLNEENFERLLAILLPAYLWMGLVFSRPHKEERFLFPIYPLLAIGAAVSLHLIIETGMYNIAQKYVFRDLSFIKMCLALVIILPFSLLSISRSILLSDGYTAPLKLHTELYNVMQNGLQSQMSEGPRLVCTGGEWYRYPSSYHLPHDTRLAFLKSSFDGQLPQQFTKFGSKEESLAHQGHFNDLNMEELDRYVDISDCSYAIDLLRNEGDGKSEVLKYIEMDDQAWQVVASFDFLDVDRTPSLHRILYLPFVRDASYSKYTLLKRNTF